MAVNEIIKYKGKEYPIRGSYYALKKATAGSDIALEDLMSKDITILEPLLFYSMVAGAHFENEKLDIKLEDMEWVLDECFEDFMRILPNFFPKLDGGMVGK